MVNVMITWNNIPFNLVASTITRTPCILGGIGSPLLSSIKSTFGLTFAWKPITQHIAIIRKNSTSRQFSKSFSLAFRLWSWNSFIYLNKLQQTRIQPKLGHYLCEFASFLCTVLWVHFKIRSELKAIKIQTKQVACIVR